MNGRSTGNLREIYGICLSNISRCSNPLQQDISRVLRDMLMKIGQSFYLAALPVYKSFGLQPLNHLGAPGLCSSLTRLGHQFVRALAIAIDV